MITTVTLNPSVDIFTQVKKLKPGSVSRSTYAFSYPGGKGANTARALATLGCVVTAAGFCGTADIAAMNEFMRRSGVRPSFTEFRGENRTCLLINESLGNVESVINGETRAAIRPFERKAFLDGLSSLAERSSHVIISGSLPLALPPDFYAKCVKACGAKTRVLLDTSSSALKNALKSSPAIIKQNASELGSALGRRLNTRASIKQAMKQVSSDYGIKTVIVTLNKKGAAMLDSGIYTFCRPVKIFKPVSPVGCGDAFSAGFIYGLSRGMDPRSSIKWASAAAAANIETPGACFISAGRVRYYLDKVRLDRY